MVKKEFALLVFLVFMSFLYLESVYAADFNYVISNSDNWRDVYSTVLFANLNSVGSDFLVSTRHGTLLLNGLNKQDSFLLVNSKRRSYVLNYMDLMKSQDFDSVSELNVDNANLDLIEQMKDITKFIIVGNTYGYNAIAVAPYAKISNSWVFFADKTNIDEINSILSNRKVDSVIIYGYVDREVRETLSKYKPDVIDSGDRFKDNTEIVNRYLKISSVKQMVLTNGEFIEKEIMSGAEPVLFTGKENVPDQIRDYIKNSPFEVGVLVGSDLVGAATNIRRSTGISVIVKFARGARAPAGSISSVEGLDLFYLPIPNIKLSIYDARYNKATNQLEVTYKSDSNIPIYLKGTITYDDSNGERSRTGDASAVFVAPNEYKTISYSDINFNGNNLTIDILTLYGDTPTSLDLILEKTLQVGIVDIIDKCNLEIKSIKYNKQKGEFITSLKNLGSVTCFASVELINLMIDNRETTLGLEGSIEIPSGKTRNAIIKQQMTEIDLSNNELVDVAVYYGERQDSLTKLIRGKLKLEIENLSILLIVLIIVAIIVLLLIIFFIWRRRKKDEEYFEL